MSMSSPPGVERATRQPSVLPRPSPDPQGLDEPVPGKIFPNWSVRGADAVSALMPYLLLVGFIPSQLVIPSLGGVGTPANVYALLMLVWYLAARLTGRLVPASWTRMPRVAMVVFSASVLFSYIAAALRSASSLEVQAADRGLIELVAWTSLVVVTSSGIGDYARLQKLLRRIVLSASVLAVLGLFEFFTNTGIAQYIQIPGLHPATGTVAVMVRGRFTRPMATAAQPLEFGAVLALVLPFAIQQAFDPAREGRVRRWLPVALIGGVLPMTVSRTAIIGLVVVLLVLLPTWKARRRWPAIGVIAVGSLGMKFAIPGLIGTITNLFSSFLNGTDNSTTARTGDYSGVAPYVEQAPVFGRGFGTFIPTLYRYTDNMYLHGLVELGIVGVLTLLFLFVAGMHCGRAGRRLLPDTSPEDEAQRDLGQAFVAAFAVAMVVSATFDTLSFSMFSGLLFLLLGAAGAYLGIARRTAAASSEPR